MTGSCPSCGEMLDVYAPTRVLADEPTTPFREARHGHASTQQAAHSLSSFDSIDDARFVPGTVLVNRYRIVGLLGRGGMGEVFRADDLKLGQAVALKFLPESLAFDGASLARFHREVRIARQISHRNVCRVYDIGEMDGRPFLSMEFIKGEELSSLIKRIGRLPSDKATEIARQLCAGLAAAHESGVLHRDLKPSNVMIDDAGNVRITDFGLAGLAEELREDELQAGTPAYMAPEQLAGRGPSVKSDIYSLGLVLYEIFTGKRAFEAATIADLVRLQEHTTPTSPSSLVKEIDPLAERVILRCLEKEPEKRPQSALQVAAALPGGDPLAAALAAGETPSPEMVAAAPKEGVLKPAVAVGLLAAFLTLLAVSIWLAGRVMLFSRVPLEKSPEVLQERAREIARRVGYKEPPTDTDYGFIVKESYINYLLANDKSRARWDQLRVTEPPVLCFWYRQSPRYLEPLNHGRVTFDDPPPTTSGMIGAVMDTEGRLVSFYRVPPQKEEARDEIAAPEEPDWSLLFTEAGLDLSNFRPTQSQWVPLYAYDARRAWEGVYPERPQIPVRVEAASYRGLTVSFEVLSPWEQPARQEQAQYGAADRALITILLGMFLATLIGSLIFATRNLRLGRGDRKGAFRLAIFLLCVQMLYLFDLPHVPTFGEWDVIGFWVMQSLFTAAFFWLVYIALEPFVRRRWPGRIISWTRLMGGGLRDPLVGRDILIGAVFGIVLICFQFVQHLLPEWLGWPSQALGTEVASVHLGLRYAASSLVSQLESGFLFGLGFLFLLLLFSIILRREWLAAAALWLLGSVALGFALSQHPLFFVIAPLASWLVLFPVVRYGLLAMMSAQFIHHLWIQYPMTFELTAWYAASFVVSLIASLALVFYAFYISLGGQPLLRGGFLED